MQWRIPESSLVVVYNRSRKVLVLQRLDDPLFWQSVTGTREAGETPLQTALREVNEETGIDILQQGYTLQDCQQTNCYPIRPLWQHRYAPGDTINTEFVFALEVADEQQIHLTEHSAYLWLDKQQAINKVWSETNKLAIRQYVPDNICDPGNLEQ